MIIKFLCSIQNVIILNSLPGNKKNVKNDIAVSISCVLLRRNFSTYTMNTKKRVVVNFENIGPDVLQAIMKKYPNGYQYHVLKVNLPNNSFFHAITVDTADASYLVKVKVKMDKVEKLEEDLFNNDLDRIPDEPDTDDSSAEDNEDTSKSE